MTDPENGNALTNPAWSYAFDTYERLSVMTDPKGRTNTFKYDAQGRQILHYLPLGQYESNSYNSLGQLALQYDFKGQMTQLVYDHLGRVKAKFRFGAGSNAPSEAVCYQYDSLGRISQVTQRYGADATTNACDGYSALMHRDRYFAATDPSRRGSGRGGLSAFFAFFRGYQISAEGARLVALSRLTREGLREVFHSNPSGSNVGNGCDRPAMSASLCLHRRFVLTIAPSDCDLCCSGYVRKRDCASTGKVADCRR